MRDKLDELQDQAYAACKEIKDTETSAVALILCHILTVQLLILAALEEKKR